MSRVYFDFGGVQRDLEHLQDVREDDEDDGGVELDDDELAVEELLVAFVVDDGVHQRDDVEELADDVEVDGDVSGLVELELDDGQQRDDEVVDREEERGVPGFGHPLEEVLFVCVRQVLLDLDSIASLAPVEHDHFRAADALGLVPRHAQDGGEDVAALGLHELVFGDVVLDVLQDLVVLRQRRSLRWLAEGSEQRAHRVGHLLALVVDLCFLLDEVRVEDLVDLLEVEDLVPHAQLDESAEERLHLVLLLLVDQFVDVFGVDVFEVRVEDTSHHRDHDDARKDAEAEEEDQQERPLVNDAEQRVGVVVECGQDEQRVERLRESLVVEHVVHVALFRVYLVDVCREQRPP